ncbi:MAG: 3-dehydroquinate synthase [Nitrospirae bacterium]|nr:3-dehydroquinate synthase [Nitrospirota bacterium]
MEKVTVELEDRSYDIVIGSRTLSAIGDRMAQFGFSPTVAVISNPTVLGLYGEDVVRSLSDAGFNCFSSLVPDGEEYKDYYWAYHILTELLRNRLDRNSCVVALGGGVIGDITGFCASLYMRGIHFIQVPTTLLAQVDSSVGGKTGVNHPAGKNMIGTFYQPRLVWTDVGTLATLPRSELLSGIAEIIKYGVIWDADLFDVLEKEREAILGLDRSVISYVIKRSCQIKAEVVSKDERESGLRAVLNYGHTIGHAVETETGYSKYLHGEAVAMGMCLAARLSSELGIMEGSHADRIKSVIGAYGLPVELPKDVNGDKLVSLISMDKKTVAGEMRFILPKAIGSVVIHKGVDVKILKRIMET